MIRKRNVTNGQSVAVSVSLRFEERVVRLTNGCWQWTGTRSVSPGKRPMPYGNLWLDGHNVRAHKYSYERTNGEVPKGMVLDHLCQNTLCVNPSHLEAVPNRINLIRGPGVIGENARKTHCIRGHLFAAGNLDRKVSKYGHATRACRTCRRIQQHAARAAGGGAK